MNVNCEEFRELVASLAPEEREVVRARPDVAAHLATCGDCAVFFENEYSHLHNVVRELQAMPAVAAPATLRERLRAEIAAEGLPANREAVPPVVLQAPKPRTITFPRLRLSIPRWATYSLSSLAVAGFLLMLVAREPGVVTEKAFAPAGQENDALTTNEKKSPISSAAQTKSTEGTQRPAKPSAKTSEKRQTKLRVAPFAAPTGVPPSRAVPSIGAAPEVPSSEEGSHAGNTTLAPSAPGSLADSNIGADAGVPSSPARRLTQKVEPSSPQATQQLRRKQAPNSMTRGVSPVQDTGLAREAERYRPSSPVTTAADAKASGPLMARLQEAPATSLNTTPMAPSLAAPKASWGAKAPQSASAESALNDRDTMSAQASAPAVAGTTHSAPAPIQSMSRRADDADANATTRTMKAAGARPGADSSNHSQAARNAPAEAVEKRYAANDVTSGDGEDKVGSFEDDTITDTGPSTSNTPEILSARPIPNEEVARKRNQTLQKNRDKHSTNVQIIRNGQLSLVSPRAITKARVLWQQPGGVAREVWEGSLKKGQKIQVGVLLDASPTAGNKKVGGTVSVQEARSPAASATMKSTKWVTVATAEVTLSP